MMIKKCSCSGWMVNGKILKDVIFKYVEQLDENFKTLEYWETF